MFLDYGSPDIAMTDADAEADIITLHLYREDYSRNPHSRRKSGRSFLLNIRAFKSVLISTSTYFGDILGEDFSSIKEINIEQEHTDAFVLWMRIFHGTLRDEDYLAPIVVIWDAITIQRYYSFEMEPLSIWFSEWLVRAGGAELEKFDVVQLQQLLFLTHEFDHAEGFAYTTRRLAYECAGQVRERNPSGDSGLYLDHRIIRSINVARGNLKTELHKALYISREFFRSNCSCKMEGYFAYGLALDKTRAWPLEENLQGTSQISIQTVLNRLKSFSYAPPNSICGLCTQNFKETVVIPAIERVEQNFDGLCLDCMDTPQRKDWDFDHQSRSRRYRKVWCQDENCRVYYRQPSFDFSKLAQKGDKNYFTKPRDKHRNKRKAAELDYRK